MGCGCYLQIRHLHSLGIRDGARDPAGADALVDFGLQRAVCERRGQEVEQGCADGGGGGVGAGNDLEECFGLALALAQTVSDE